MSSNFPPGYTEDNEPGSWFEDLAEAPINTKCHECGDPAELIEEDDVLWCCQCAGEHDYELQNDPDLLLP